VLAFAIILSLTYPAHAAEDRTEKRGEFTLEFKDLTGEADQAAVDRLRELFFAVYPQLVAEYNPDAYRTVLLQIDPGYVGQAAASANKVMLNPDHLRRNPEDIDSLVHELMHVVQAYNFWEAPPWLREGIADFVRDKYGVNNAAAGWALERRPVGSDWTMSYRVTGAFLRWIEVNGHPGFVRNMNAPLRTETYTEATWQALTGKTVEALWEEYSLTETSEVPVTSAKTALLTDEQIARLRLLPPDQIAAFREQMRGTAIETQLKAVFDDPVAVVTEGPRH